MNDELRQRAMHIAADLASVPKDSREANLESACGSNIELRSEVECILTHIDAAAADGFLDTKHRNRVLEFTTITARFRSASALPKHWPPQTIGEYRITKFLGAGGMGAVYEAVHDNPYRRVAIKVAHKELISGHVSSGQWEAFVEQVRFEGQALADVRHHNIVKFYGTGVTEDCAYLVLELVEGTPIVEYCNKNKLNLQKRLQLFLKACSAVSAFHEAQYIHGDLKPANILVDDHGRLVVVDLGIAQLLHAQLQARFADVQTRNRAWVSPRYASPEKRAAQRLTFASDVYSLGVILREMLNGASNNLPENNGAEGSSRSHLARAFELRAIVSMALRQNNTIRRGKPVTYSTVDKLSGDVKRYLGKLPIRACPSAPWYRIWKSLSRRPAAFGSVAALLILSSSWAIRERFQQREASVLLARAREAEEHATRERDDAYLVKDLVAECLAVTDVDDQSDSTAIAARLNERANAKLAETVRQRPDLEAEVRIILGMTWLGQGFPRAAVKMLSRALKCAKQAYGEDHPETINCMNGLAGARLAEGDVRIAIALFSEAYEKSKRAPTSELDRKATNLSNYGYALLAAGDPEKALPLLKEAVACARLFGKDDELTASALTNLALCIQVTPSYGNKTDRCNDALEALREVLAIRRLKAETQAGLLARAFLNLGDALRQCGKGSNDHAQVLEAEDTIKEAVGILRRKFGPQNVEYANGLSGLGVLLCDLRRWDEASAKFDACLAIRLAKLGPAHPDVARCRYHKARSITCNPGSSAEDLKEANHQLELAIKSHEATLAADHPETIVFKRERDALEKRISQLGVIHTRGVLLAPRLDAVKVWAESLFDYVKHRNAIEQEDFGDDPDSHRRTFGR